MPSGNYKSDIKCPYYRTDNGRNTIGCEGLLPDSSMTHYLRTTASFERQIEVFCSDKYYCCEICTALDKKYEEEEI